MLSVFLLQNQYDQYLGKSGEWLSGADSKTLYRTEHKDEAINQKVEVAVKQADTRAKIVDGFQLLNGQVMLSEDEPLPVAAEREIDTVDEANAEVFDENSSDHQESHKCQSDQESEPLLFETPANDTVHDADQDTARKTDHQQTDTGTAEETPAAENSY